MTIRWPISWFRSPGLTEATPLTVEESGRVFGHAALWGTKHLSFPGRAVTPPRSRTDYSLFHVGSTTVVGDDGRDQEVSVGTLVMGSGHADTRLSAAETAEWYDTTSTVAAAVCAGEDEIGIWVAGATMPDLDEVSKRRLKCCAISGDWRYTENGGGLDLVALLAVSTPGFPIPRARVASGAPMALVAAGALAPAAAVPFARRVDPSWRAAQQTQVDVGALADAIIARMDAAGQAVEHAKLLSQVDDTAAVTAALLAEVDDTPLQMAALFAELDGESFDISRMPPQLKKEWLAGKVAARIGWGSPGDFDRCVAQARKHNIPAHERDGLCSNLHREALGGKSPGHH